jgi:UDP-N-acetylglucosamine kinase
VTNPELASYLLPEDRSAEIFREQIIPALLADATPQSQPVLIVLTAQPGAGKSVLRYDIRASFPEGSRPVVVDVDSFRPFYPQYQRLLQTHGWAADDLVQADARRWLDLALAYLTEQRAHVIVEHGLRDLDVTNTLLARFTQTDTQMVPYRIEGALLATSAAQSRLGMLERYQISYERIGLGRYVSEELHDTRYRHVLDVADWLDADARVTAMTIYRRGTADPVHRNERGLDGRWRVPVASRDALSAERNRPWSLEESRIFLRVHHSLSARMTPQWKGSLDSAREAAQHLLDPSAGVPRYDKPAVTFGRYQIVSIAHLDTIRTILLDWPTVEIGVLDLDSRPAGPLAVPPHLRDFYQGCEANTSPAKNPMTAEERASFWRATVAEAGLQDRVAVRIIARPELDPEGFNRQYPLDRFNLVFPTASGEGFDLVRNASFSEILRRRVYPVDPPLEYHTSDIRSAYRAGNEAWKHGFAPGGLQAFIAVDGPRRLLGDVAATDKTQAQRAIRAAMHGLPRAGRRATPDKLPTLPPARRPPDRDHGISR